MDDATKASSLALRFMVGWQVTAFSRHVLFRGVPGHTQTQPMPGGGSSSH